MSLEGSLHENRDFDGALTYLKTTYAKASEEANYLKEQLEIANKTIEEYRVKEASEASLKASTEEVTELKERLDKKQTQLDGARKLLAFTQKKLEVDREKLDIAHTTIREQNEQLLLQNAVMKREKKSEKKKFEKREKVLIDRIAELEKLLEKERMNRVNGEEKANEMREDSCLLTAFHSFNIHSNGTPEGDQVSLDNSTLNSILHENSNGNSEKSMEDSANEEAEDISENELQRDPRYHSIIRCVESLTHSAKCTDSACTDVSCRKMKRVIAHTQVCKNRETASCPVCKQIIALCCYHAKYCTIVNCEVPNCLSIRHKLDVQRERIAQQELESTNESALKVRIYE